MAMIRCPADRRERRPMAVFAESPGFALPAALLMLVMIAALAVDRTATARADRLAALNYVTELHTRAAAEAGVAHGMAALDELARQELSESSTGAAALRELERRLGKVNRSLARVDITPTTWYSVRIWPDGSRLSVNHATAAELGRFLRALGANTTQAHELAERIVASRSGLDGSGAVRRGGYRYPHEIRDLPGMEDWLFSAAAPHLTVHGTGRINLGTAPRPVLLALPGITTEAAKLILERRAAGNPITTLPELQAALPVTARPELQAHLAVLLGRISFEARSFEIEASGRSAGSPVRTDIRTVVRRSGTRHNITWSSEI